MLGSWHAALGILVIMFLSHGAKKVRLKARALRDAMLPQHQIIQGADGHAAKH
jgi:hypothetical protein